MKRVLYIFCAVALLVATLSAPAAPAAAQTPSRSYVLISATSTLPAGLEAAVAQAGGAVVSADPQIGIAVAVSADANFKARAGKIRGVRSVVPNLTYQFISPDEKKVEADFGNPPFSGDDDTRFDLQWGHDAVNAPEAWNAGVFGAGVRVAVLDTGFDLDHPDLAPNINLALSKNFVEGETLSYALPDSFSHGTHTAGTIAAADNGFGTIGVAPQAELVLVKVLSDAGSGSFDDIVAAIVYAADVDADIISMSLGAVLVKSGFCDEEGCVTAKEVSELRVALSRAVAYANQQGTTVFASEGNEAIDKDHTANLITLPADTPKVISISATAPIGWAVDPLNAFLDYPTSYTNYGKSAVDFAAPGGDSVYPGNENCLIAGLVRPCWVFDLVFSTGSSLDPNVASYYWSAGTSMAVPHAVGVAALLISANGGSMKPAQVEAALRANADDLGKPGNDEFYGQGRVATGY